jgi:hypothetical protein
LVYLELSGVFFERVAQVLKKKIITDARGDFFEFSGTYAGGRRGKKLTKKI